MSELKQGNPKTQKKKKNKKPPPPHHYCELKEEYSTEYIFHSSCFRSRTDNSYLAQIRTVGNDDSDVDDTTFIIQ